MAPSAIETPVLVPEGINGIKKSKSGLIREPTKYQGNLDGYSYIEVTPQIGREYTNINLKELLRAPNSDDLIRDLAVTVSERGVCFFRNQDNADNETQKELVQRMGELVNKPKESKLYIHPSINYDKKYHNRMDEEISTISSEETAHLFKHRYDALKKDRLLQKKAKTAYWHSDIAFEKVPADYSCLRLEKLGPTGGDTLWANAYELYDRFSEPWQKFLEGLTCHFGNPGFEPMMKVWNFDMYTDPRGHPLNAGSTLGATHPAVRTNPVTGWKALYGIGHAEQRPRFNELTKLESDRMNEFLEVYLLENHDAQVRFRWNGPNDVALWDNRSTFHTATMDTAGQGPRFGQRAVGIGEPPYLDPASQSRRDALGLWLKDE
ncbi:TfdA family taurine dioxygenase [Pseudovirgaria hyperparasitica]|uniref:TfdA family taurine dioxygenase n=1 Tax=Pseudovirgaria hyperparasitica TaxID=470096 RepID=A0A6A6W6H2_9PEZI|nr:TfdA family taurine dioxygenase [Pseudovirgaria hyperparasitica]KAF2757624.1 TfdA family taurine dioxygenase [Pseudovirgaria hyperparasitica]